MYLLYTSFIQLESDYQCVQVTSHLAPRLFMPLQLDYLTSSDLYSDFSSSDLTQTNGLPERISRVSNSFVYLVPEIMLQAIRAFRPLAVDCFCLGYLII